MKRLLASLMLGSAAIAIAATANAETLRWARAGDSLTLDPHAQNEGPTHTLAHQIYEPLLHRDMAGQIVPALATEWAPTEDPSVWRFKLREGVTFHDGAPFTASDVVFSLNRAMMPDSDMKELLASVKEVTAVDDLTVDITTDGPNPILPSNLTNLFIMDEDWSKSNGVEKPQDFEGGEETFAVRNANGTGAYMLAERAPDSKTVLKQNPNYWGKGEFPLEVTEIVFTPVQNAATRVAALLSGEVDFIQDVPVQDLGRVEAADGLVVRTAPQNRTIFFGINVGDADLKSDNVDGKNPFADKRVREAMNMALNRDAIRQVVMRGQSQPTGVIMPPFVNGWTEALDAVPPTDVAKAKELMAEAGYGDGFSVTLNCPNDRYINDEAICQAAVGMLGQIGIKVALDAKPKAQHFPLINNLETDFYMLGWGVPTFDSEYIFNFLVHTKGEKYGSWNGTRYSNPELDKMIEGLASETDLAKRDAMIAEIWSTVQGETIYLPLHHQVLNWGMKTAIDFPVQPEDQPHFKYLTYAK
ncbi:ABC transporter substrate-binding protein [Limibaculum sp. M0105]|uniref:ABC transporter substrate-binding protein n=1 Tax=Thermohalobaculum xanthum TaxID=2753746 RepID=A0A8J7M7Y8_9RHOB|nr:ABC transporter substrate-binding protein [Thermohalobaculum xanthum]MBK0400241.1 ABC transporter substrate-binding protein [Thermohalobaculum xanthum]